MPVSLQAAVVNGVTVRPKEPVVFGWRKVGPHYQDPAPGVPRIIGGWIYERSVVRVISSLDLAKLPQREDTGPQWHISISRKGKRAPAEDVERALRAFDMIGAENDNHHPGIAQHFFMPCDPTFRVACECKAEETVVVEADGYTWSHDPDDVDRQCCAVGKLHGLACPLHPEEKRT